jgi:hypothetical protein
MRFAPAFLLMIFLLGVASFGHAEEQERLKPYVLAKTVSGDLNTVVDEVKAALTDAEFEILGSYSPYEGAFVIAITSDDVLSVCQKTENGAFAAALRVTVTAVGDELQIAYNCPRYMANAYRLDEDLANVKRLLSMTLGYEKAFGSEDGLTIKSLRDYNYVPGGFIPMPMPEFDDVDELAEFASFEDAIAAVDAGFAEQSSASPVYRLEIPGTEAVLYGVGISDGHGADETVMGTTDLGDLKATPHLPYEMLVSGNKVIALRGKFRIAQSFPDLSMGTFMKIRKAPGAIQETLESVAGND